MPLRRVGELGILVVVVACTAPALPSQVAPSAAPTMSQIGPDMTAAVVYFPQHNVSANEPGWQAVTRGRISRVGECIVLRSEFGEDYLPLWPPEYVLTAAEPLRISTLPGQPTVQPGLLLRFVGGEFVGSGNDQLLTTLLGGRIPPNRCLRERYWVVTAVDFPP